MAARNQESGRAERCWSDVVGRDARPKHTDLRQKYRISSQNWCLLGTELVRETTALCWDPHKRTFEQNARQ